MCSESCKNIIHLCHLLELSLASLAALVTKRSREERDKPTTHSEFSNQKKTYPVQVDYLSQSHDWIT
jgi:hypothetical protein